MRKLMVILAMLMLLAPAAFAATVVTTPANSATLTLGSTYSFTGTTAIVGSGSESFNCSWYYRHKGTTAWTLLGTNSELNLTTLSATVPDSFGTNQFNLTCDNGTIESGVGTMSVAINRYDAGEIAETSVDTIVAVGILFISFATLIGLVLLFGWIKGKMPKF